MNFVKQPPMRTRFRMQRPIKRPTYEPSGGTILVQSVVHARGFGIPIVSMGAQFVAVASTVHTRAFGTPKLSMKIYPSSVIHTRGFGVPKLNLGVKPSSVVHVRAFGSTSVLRGQRIVAPSSVVHARAFGTPALQVDTTIYPTSVIHTRGWGYPRVSNGPWFDPAMKQHSIKMQTWEIGIFDERPVEPEVVPA